MDTTKFRWWALVDAGLALATTQETIRRLERFERLGLGLEAVDLDAQRAFLAALASGKRHAYRNACKALNLWNASQGSDHHWDLPKSPKSQHKRFTDAEVQALLDYGRGSRRYHVRRRRAILWICWATGLRRGEIADLHVDDLREDRGVLLVRNPRKEGKKREIPLPLDAWSPKRPVQSWIRAKKPGPSLWDGLTPHELGSIEMLKVSRQLGFTVSVTRFRHYRGKTLGKHLVPIQVIQEAMGHATPNTTKIYMEELTAGEMADAFRRAKVPGFRT